MANQSSNVNRRKVGRTVTYWTATRKPLPAVITEVAGNGGAVLRIGRFDNDSGTAGIQYLTFGNSTTGITRKVNRTDTNVWSS